jgi:hypothetical protein
LKKIRKYRSYSAEDASETLSRWCGAASENIVESFNSVFYIGTEESLSGRPIYEWMCRKRNIRPITSVTSNPSHNDIEEHLHAEPIEGLGVVKKKNNNFTIGTTLLDDTLENVMKKYKPFTPNPKNIFNEFPEISGPSKEALEFFGISDIPKEKL